MAENWEKPVTLALEGPGKYTTISNTTEASWAMIEDWPLEDSALLTQALDTCAAVIEGKQSAEAARQAFINAAHEAGLHIQE